MDIFEALTNDHDQLKPLLNKLVTASENNDETKQLLDQILSLLIPHSRAEEAVFYNSLREIPDTKDLVGESYQEHAKAETLLRTLRGMATINADWTKGVRKLKEDLEHHIAEEEGPIFQAARQVLLEEETHQMAKAFARMKPEIQEQGAIKNTLEMVANLMPKRFSEKFRASA